MCTSIEDFSTVKRFMGHSSISLDISRNLITLIKFISGLNYTKFKLRIVEEHSLCSVDFGSMRICLPFTGGCRQGDQLENSGMIPFCQPDFI